MMANKMLGRVSQKENTLPGQRGRVLHTTVRAVMMHTLLKLI